MAERHDNFVRNWVEERLFQDFDHILVNPMWSEGTSTRYRVDVKAVKESKEIVFGRTIYTVDSYFLYLHEIEGKLSIEDKTIRVENEP